MSNCYYTPTTSGGIKLKRNYIWGYAKKEKKRLNTTELVGRDREQYITVRSSEFV
jgi:hypothetical protein